MAMLCLLLLLGPSQTLSGKYARPENVVSPAPVAQPAADDVDGWCHRIQQYGATPERWEALGSALLAQDKPMLAYRAFHKAHRARPKDGAWGRKMQARKAGAEFVDDAIIAAEEREGKAWSDALVEFRKAQRASDRDTGGLSEFYARYGRPEDNLWLHVRARRLSFAGGACGILVGLAYVLGSGLLSRRAVWLPVFVSVACLLGPSALGQTGLFHVGAGASLLGACVVYWRSGRRVASA